METNFFELYPTLTHYFQTSDGTAFYIEPDARMHGRTLENKEVVRVDRPVPAPVVTEKTKK